MKLRLAICVAALALAACGKVETAGDGETPGAAAKRMPLPECSSVETKDAGADGWKHPDCRLMLSDNSGLAIEARYKPAEDDSTKVTVQVVQPGDATVQTIEETMGNTFEPVSLDDIDKDGKQDIRIPLETGNVNTSWALWRQKDDKTFVRIGEPSGVSIVNTPSGYIAVQARSSANEWSVPFFKLEGDELKPVVTADVIARGEPNKITGVDCTLTDDGGLASTGLDPKAAEAQFCAEPVVAEIFN
jgi:hypothetical protein